MMLFLEPVAVEGPYRSWGFPGNSPKGAAHLWDFLGMAVMYDAEGIYRPHRLALMEHATVVGTMCSIPTVIYFFASRIGYIVNSLNTTCQMKYMSPCFDGLGLALLTGYSFCFCYYTPIEVAGMISSSQSSVVPNNINFAYSIFD